jgi:hypothetical protein
VRDTQCERGATSLRAIAKALNARGVATARGGVWTPVQVTAVLRRTVDNFFGIGREHRARDDAQSLVHHRFSRMRRALPLLCLPLRSLSDEPETI